MAAAPARRRIPLADGDVAVEVRRSRRARRLALRLDEAGGTVALVLPRGVTLAEGLAFARSRRDWIARRLDALPPRVPFAEGASIPLLGRPHRIRRLAEPGGTIDCRDGEIRITGPATALPGRLGRWLRTLARAELSARVAAHAATLGLAPPPLTLRDARTRWGSCSATGRLSFSWRLVLAPESVLDYVAAHEVAHLRQRNHGPRFWALVADLCPDHAEARAWLRANGGALHRYG